MRYVPYSRRCVGSRSAFARSTKKIHNRNTILLRVGSDGNREDVRRSLVGTKSEPFRLWFAYFSRNISRIKYKMRKIWEQIVVILGLFHHFYFLALENKVIKRCSSSICICRVSGAGMPGFHHFIHRLHDEKSFQNLNFGNLAILSTTCANYGNYRYKCFDFLRQTDIIEKHSIAKVFAKTPILARPQCVLWYVRNRRVGVPFILCATAFTCIAANGCAHTCWQWIVVKITVLMPPTTLSQQPLLWQPPNYLTSWKKQQPHGWTGNPSPSCQIRPMMGCAIVLAQDILSLAMDEQFDFSGFQSHSLHGRQ